MTTVHNAFPAKDIYFTEITGSQPGNFASDLQWHMMNIVNGGPLNWARAVVEWNLVLDQNNGPIIGTWNQGQPIVTVNTGTAALTRYSTYYAIAHASKFVKPGAQRISCTSYGAGFIIAAGYKNPDGSRVIVASNNAGSAQTFKIIEGNKEWPVTIQAGDVQTFVLAAVTAGPIAVSAVAGHVIIPSVTITAGSGVTVPGAPTIGTATAGSASASVTFTAPGSNGGAAIDTYRVTSSLGPTATGASSPITISGLATSAQTFTVAAHNSVGYGAESAASNSITPTAGSAFVTRSGTNLTLNGQNYKFTGFNAYNILSDNSVSYGCWYNLTSGNNLDTVLANAGPAGTGQNEGRLGVFRGWFFQNSSMSTTGSGVRDWSRWDKAISVCKARGVRLIPVLCNVYDTCEGGASGTGANWRVFDSTTKIRTGDWFLSGYNTAVDPSSPVGSTTYRAFVAEAVARYKNEPTIAFWQLVNEAECNNATNGTLAKDCLLSFANDVGGLIHSLDPNHLVSLGTLGSGQGGASYLEYAYVHASAGIDICEYHDYWAQNVPMGGDAFNGIQERISQAIALNKPIFAGEMGIQDTDGSRSADFAAKIDAQFTAGCSGALVWSWANAGESGAPWGVGPGDPTIAMLGSRGGLSSGGGGSQRATRSGKVLQVNGTTWHAFGASVYGQIDSSGKRGAEITLAVNAHLNFIRIVNWLDESSNNPDVAAYDGTRWGYVDDMIKRASDAGLKVLLDFATFRNMILQGASTNPYSSGQYTRWNTFIDFVMNRTNTVSGLRYGDDTTIAIVSIAGEPAAPLGTDTNKPANTAELSNFYSHMSARIKAAAPNLLTCPGGFLFLDWNSGIDYQAIGNDANMDINALHPYGSADRTISVPNMASWSNSANKPWMWEEFGYDTNTNTDSQRSAGMQSGYSLATSNNACGIGFWNLGPGSGSGGDSYDVNASNTLTWATVLSNAPA
jgi:endo-1,4-beta-mannosidase